jgi:16S rRNA (uracil1498-N3)-methyltransferase
MGVGRLVPVMTARTQGGKHINVDKIAANVIEAAEQCNIMTLPDVAAPQRLADALAAFPDDRQIIFCDEAAGADAQLDAAALKGQKLALLIGPEGGFDADERAMVKARANVHTLTLGPRILRTDTAVVAALARLQAQLGDW